MPALRLNQQLIRQAVPGARAPANLTAHQGMFPLQRSRTLLQGDLTEGICHMQAMLLHQLSPVPVQSALLQSR